MKRLGDNEPAQGTRKEGHSQGVLPQPRREERPDVLRQKGDGSLLEKGPSPKF